MKHPRIIIMCVSLYMPHYMYMFDIDICPGAQCQQDQRDELS